MIIQFPSSARMQELPMQGPKSTLPAYVERFARFLRTNASSEGYMKSRRSWKSRGSKRKTSSKIVDIAKYLKKSK